MSLYDDIQILLLRHGDESSLSTPLISELAEIDPVIVVSKEEENVIFCLGLENGSEIAYTYTPNGVLRHFVISIRRGAAKVYFTFCTCLGYLVN